MPAFLHGTVAGPILLPGSCKRITSVAHSFCGLYRRACRNKRRESLVRAPRRLGILRKSR